MSWEADTTIVQSTDVILPGLMIAISVAAELYAAKQAVTRVRSASQTSKDAGKARARELQKFIYETAQKWDLAPAGPSPQKVVEQWFRDHAVPTATSRGTFVQVKPGHPAYHRW